MLNNKAKYRKSHTRKPQPPPFRCPAPTRKNKKKNNQNNNKLMNIRNKARLWGKNHTHDTIHAIQHRIIVPTHRERAHKSPIQSDQQRKKKKSKKKKKRKKYTVGKKMNSVSKHK